MARFKNDNVVWVSIDPETLDAQTAAIHAELRESFEHTKAIKARLEASLAPKLAKLVASWPAEAKKEQARYDEAIKTEPDSDRLPARPFTDAMRNLCVRPDGTFQPDTVRKFSYMRGIGVASVPAAKAKAASGLKLS